MNTSRYARIALLTLGLFSSQHTVSARLHTWHGMTILAVGCVAGASGLIAGQMLRRNKKVKKVGGCGLCKPHWIGKNCRDLTVRGTLLSRDKQEDVMQDAAEHEVAEKALRQKKSKQKLIHAMDILTSVGVTLAIVGSACWAIAGTQRGHQEQSVITGQGNRLAKPIESKPKELVDPSGLLVSEISRQSGYLSSSEQDKNALGLQWLLGAIDRVSANNDTIRRMILSRAMGVLRSSNDPAIRHTVYEVIIKAVGKGYYWDKQEECLEVDLGLQITPYLLKDVESLSQEELSLFRNIMISFGEMKNVCKLLESDNPAVQEYGKQIISYGVRMPGKERGDDDIIIKDLCVGSKNSSEMAAKIDAAMPF